MAEPDTRDTKLSYFQAVTGLEDPDLCTEILTAHGWDLELAISSITSAPSPSPSPIPGQQQQQQQQELGPSNPVVPPPHHNDPPAPGLAWKLITLPFYVVSGGFGLIVGAVGIGAWIAGGVLSRSLGLLGLSSTPTPSSADRLIPLSASAAEAVAFVTAFDRDHASAALRPNFAAVGFMDALQRAQQEFRLLFVYLHSPDHPDSPEFCSGCLCSEAVATFVNENFVCWGGSIRGSEGFKMSNSLKASRFPFCAIVAAASNQQIMLLQQIEGPVSPDRMLMILNQVVEESNPSLVSARLEAEERANNLRLRQEQDAAYRAALEADQARERQMKEEQERLEREAAEAEQKRKEEEEARERAARETAEKEAALARRRQEKAMSLGIEPVKGPDVTQVLVRFPNGERKERRFHSSATVRSLYDYVDSLDCSTAEKYNLISNFPRVCYGPEKHSLTLKEAGLHPQASLFIEME